MNRADVLLFSIGFCFPHHGRTTGRPLFKLVETDFISRELIRYDAADAELLGLYSIDEVLHNLKVITPEVDGGGANATSKLQNTTAEEGKEDSPEVSPAVTPCSDSEGFVGGGVVEDTGETVEKLAIKRTYQPSVLKRKRKHGYLSRVKTRLGKRIIQRRLEKGRWRMAV
ncbi:unnamed protein product [Discosporangium mesarthrocarpum]